MLILEIHLTFCSTICFELNSAFGSLGISFKSNWTIYNILAVAFEVTLDDANNLVKRHPPKRLQRLGEQPTSPITHETIAERLAEAEARRLQVWTFYFLNCLIIEAISWNSKYRLLTQSPFVIIGLWVDYWKKLGPPNDQPVSLIKAQKLRAGSSYVVVTVVVATLAKFLCPKSVMYLCVEKSMRH